jgi:cyanate lyase
MLARQGRRARGRAGGVAEHDRFVHRAVLPTDPLIYRFYEIMQVYGTTIKELIQDEFGTAS